MIINTYKKLGETPYECMERYRMEHPELKGVSLTYAGRLDPLAEGVLIVLGGDDIKSKEEFISLPKQYKFEVLWGFETDTYDPLGIVQSSALVPENVGEVAKKNLSQYLGKIVQLYPPFSSKPVKGKPLFVWAREGRLVEISIPQNDIEVYSIDALGERKLLGSELEKEITRRVALVKGDFRQKEIIDSWQVALAEYQEKEFTLSSFRISCSGGTYVRGIARSFGLDAGCGALAFSILREKVGKYEVEKSITNS